MFAHSIKTNSKSPTELKSLIVLPAPDDEIVTLTEQTQDAYNLRRGRVLIKKVSSETKYETLTFKHFFPKLLKVFKHFDFYLNKDSFKLQINLNLDENLKKFFDKFPKFDIKYTAFFRKKKKKLGKTKRNKIKLN